MDDNIYGLLGNPIIGGLLATNYPNPYGLRAYQNKDGSYGGQMMPKGNGWMGVQVGKGKMKGQKMTEYSTGDDIGDFPTIYQNMPQGLLNQVLNGNVTEEVYQGALEAANKRRALGLSPFKDIWDK